MENQNITTAIIAGINSGDDVLFNYEMKELEALCEACGIQVKASFIQNLPHPQNGTYFGTGKLQELAIFAKEQDVTYIVINDELGPAQYNNITEATEVAIMDRTNLILKIFEIRAKTKEAALQVELAKLNYTLPRLIGARANLSRIGGSSGGQGGTNRGAGETKLELDKRYIENRIYKVRCELDDVVMDRKTTRKQRLKNGSKTVAFVGYTNAGKSSTINSLLAKYDVDKDKEVFVKDMLFATLETSTRRLNLENNHELLLTDTVGFVSKLPHHLVESFKSTLEEINEASLIIHLIDASSPYMELQVETTDNVLSSLGVGDIPIVYVFSKIDKVKNECFLPSKYNNSLKISNKSGEGIDELLNFIDQTLYPDDVSTTLLIPYDKGTITNVLMEKAHIKNTEYTNDGTKLDVTMSKHLYNLYKEYEIK